MSQFFGNGFLRVNGAIMEVSNTDRGSLIFDSLVFLSPFFVCLGCFEVLGKQVDHSTIVVVAGVLYATWQFDAGCGLLYKISITKRVIYCGFLLMVLSAFSFDSLFMKTIKNKLGRYCCFISQEK